MILPNDPDPVPFLSGDMSALYKCAREKAIEMEARRLWALVYVECVKLGSCDDECEERADWASATYQSTWRDT